jgi:hypothetical protein
LALRSGRTVRLCSSAGPFDHSPHQRDEGDRRQRQFIAIAHLYPG